MTEIVKHTPGEWTAKWSKYNEGELLVQAGMPTNRVLAIFDGDGDGPDEQSLADAHLISAAPDMLKALKRIVHEWDGEPEDMAEAREAIAKATGGSNA
ncbi:MAG: hypothetical protein CML24_11640 [Rhizobiales bacterium]|mgnify:CR=1 FL=1|nr:hypothetical protein [Hyphomicrobiales bacterium]|tara:strand:+ start:24885 stop:25178 length:294 start_codon:yes stop_codon:yes gene_type:complete